MNLRVVNFMLMGLVLSLRASASVLYVDVNTTNPAPPYGSLTSAAASNQTAVDAATNGDLILVNDGFYLDGFAVTKESVTDGLEPKTISVTNRVVVDKPLTVQSINGPSAVFISGSGMYRCIYLTNGVVLSGFTLMNGVAGWISTTRIFGGKIQTNIGGLDGTTTYIDTMATNGTSFFYRVGVQ